MENQEIYPQIQVIMEPKVMVLEILEEVIKIGIEEESLIDDNKIIILVIKLGKNNILLIGHKGMLQYISTNNKNSI